MISYSRFALLLLSTQLVTCTEARLGDNNVRLSKENKSGTHEEIRTETAKRVTPFRFDHGLHDGAEAHLRRMQSVLPDSLAFEQ